MTAARPFPIPQDFGLERPRAATYLARAATASSKSFVTGVTPANVVKSLWEDDRVTGTILRAASSPATTTTSGWAKELASVAVLDIVQSITSLSAAADVIDRALKLNMDGIAQYFVPGRALTAAAAGSWVAEGASSPVRSLNFTNAAILQLRKLEVITAFTREMMDHSNIEAVVRQTLGEAIGLALDLKMFSTDAASASAPAGLFAGTAALTPTAGGGDNAMHGDLANLFGALATKSGGKTAVIIAAMPQAVRLKLVAGPKFDYDIISSTALAAGTVAVVEVASLVSGFGSVAEFNTSKVAALHMEDTTPGDISGSTPVKSMFQIDAIALRTSLWAAWGLRAAGHCQYLTGATW
jgi:hypothetical protein